MWLTQIDILYGERIKSLIAHKLIPLGGIDTSQRKSYLKNRSEKEKKISSDQGKGKMGKFRFHKWKKKLRKRK